MPKTRPSFGWEDDIRQSGFNQIAGLDEVGRGCLAGPLVAASVVLPDDPSDAVLDLINDSKVLSQRQRERAFDAIMSTANSVGIGSCDSEEVTRWASRRQRSLRCDGRWLTAVRSPTS